jgi:hypothetical protein
MRVFAQILLIGTLGGWVLAHPVPRRQAPGRDPAPILAAAREALGGEKRLSGVKNFVATGRTRQVRGDNLVPIEFEIAVELPDKYVRKDEIPAQESGPTSTGFNGDELIQLPVPTPPAAPPAGAAGRTGGPPPAPTQAQLDAARNARVAAVKQDFVRLTLGMFAGSFSSYPLTFTYIGEAEAPQGKADVLEAKAAPNFSLRLFINSQTHLPIMVSWQQAPGRAGGGRGRGDAPPGEGRGRGDAPPAAGRGATPRPEGGTPATPAPGNAPATAPAPASAPAAPPTTAPAPPQAAPAGAPGAPAAPGAGAPNGGRSAAPPPSVESRIYYADYRDVDGLQWPFRLRRATGPDTTEETTFDRFKINTKIDPKKFEVRK